jgi:hypothetical protein
MISSLVFEPEALRVRGRVEEGGMYEVTSRRALLQRALALAAVATVLLGTPATAHHSDAGVDMASVVRLEGTVRQFFWRNPHVYFTVVTDGADGAPVEWSVQMGSAVSSARQGWTRNTLQPGDHVVVAAHPAANGRPYAIFESLEKEGGLTLGKITPEPDGTARAASIAGRWLQKSAETPSYPGGIDGYFRAKIVPTDKGRQAQAAFDALSDENPEARCIGRPTPAMIHSSSRYPIEITIDEAADTVTIRSQYWDERRTVYLDGRPHPPADQRFASGHSIGWWEDATLVVDTQNFADHRSPYQIGLPSGSQKHVVELYRLTDGGTRLQIEFMLEDPEYIAEPMFDSRKLAYAPDIEMLPFNCDPEATRGFMRVVH